MQSEEQNFWELTVQEQWCLREIKKQSDRPRLAWNVWKGNRAVGEYIWVVAQEYMVTLVGMGRGNTRREILLNGKWAKLATYCHDFRFSELLCSHCIIQSLLNHIESSFISV